MKKIFCCFLLSLTVFFSVAEESVPHSIKCISHHGERFDAPIHSAPAYRLAMARKADLMKIDVHFTKDAVAVLSHDRTLKKTMNWNVRIKDKTLQELKTHGTFLPVGNYRDEKIMTLREGLEITKDCPEFFLDNKTFPVAPEFGWKSGSALEAALVEFDRAGISRSRIIVCNFGDKLLKYAQKNLPELRRVKHIYLKRLPAGKTASNFFPAVPKTRENVVPYLLKEKKRLGLWGVNLPQTAFLDGLLTGEDLKKLRASGLWVSIWFVNDPVSATFFSLHGVDAFVTDKIEMVRPFCRQREKSRK